MKPRKATMADVAREAGVSPATVARVLYANGYVVAEKRTIVEGALRKTGYRPNVMARGLRTSRSFTMGMVVSECRLNAFHPYVAHEVQIEALKHGYSVLTLNNNHSDAVEDAGVQRFLDQHVDAIIFCGAVSPNNVRLTASAGIPTVQVEREVSRIGNKVLVDPQPGMNEAVAHLRELGHERIAYIGGMLNERRVEKQTKLSVEEHRERAFGIAMTGAGLSVSPELIQLGPYHVESSNRQTGHVLMRRLLALENPPTAVITGSDLLAAGALQAIREENLMVPGDISVIGYDDTMAEVLTPPLTSIAQPIAELGRMAVTVALHAIGRANAKPRVETFRTKLVLRASTAQPRVRSIRKRRLLQT
jgi:DNA-binding LacI/PurR family transcriptional regulator